MKIKSLLIGLSATLLAVAPVATSFAPSANAKGPSVGVGAEVSVDTAEFYKQAASQIQNSQNRTGFVKALGEQAFYRHKGKYNVMVFNQSQNYTRSLKDVLYFVPIQHNKVNYGIWVFKEGTFTNKGDGSYKNWAFFGKFKKSGKDNKTVTFQPIS
jgi:hypothetical protein